MCNSHLPVYVSEQTAEEQLETLAFVQKQVANIKSQEAIGVPSQHVKVRCGCNKYSRWLYMFQCLYCRVWFCKECAEEHFGKRAPKWSNQEQEAGQS